MVAQYRYTKNLEELGFTREQAEGQVKVMSEVVDNKGMTREDFLNAQMSHEKNFDLKIDHLKSHVNLEFQNIRNEIHTEFKDVRHEMRTEFKNVRHEMKTEFKNVRHEMKTEFKNVRHEMKTEFKDFREEMRTDFKEMNLSINSILIKLSSLFLLFSSIGFTILGFLIKS